MKSLCALLVAAAGSVGLPQQAPPPSPEILKQGADIYEANCAACHDHPEGRIPPRSFITVTKSPEYIIRALTNGPMMQQGSNLTPQQRIAVATYLVGKRPGEAPAALTANRCRNQPKAMSIAASDWNGWAGGGEGNVRYHRTSGLTAANLSKLKMKWAFAYPGGASGQPAIVGGRVFAPSIAGVLFSLDAATGCTYWAADLGAPLRSAVTIGKLPSGRFAAYIGDMHGEVHALDTQTGKEIWRKRIEDHPMVRLTGPVTLFDGRLYAPVSSFEESSARDPKYPCCTFRGALVALDAATGRMIWKTHTIDEKPAPLGDGHHFGPAGAAVWAAPTVDAKRRVVYISTGNGYTEPAAPTTNSVIAIDMDTGAKRWSKQMLPNDVFVDGCFDAKTINCPKGDLGPDFDLGGSPLLVTGADSKQAIVLTSKSGMVHALDPDNKGALLWASSGGRGGLMGGTEWGAASDGEKVYVPITDIGGRARDPAVAALPMPGLNAFSVSTGKLAWRVPAPTPVCSWGQPCTAAYHAAPTVINGAVFSGAFDGHERAYSTTDGRLLWDFDTGRSFDAVNGGKATGGSIDQGGQMVAGNQLFINSGARNGFPGNLLLAFALDGADRTGSRPVTGAKRSAEPGRATKSKAR